PIIGRIRLHIFHGTARQIHDRDANRRAPVMETENMRPPCLWEPFKQGQKISERIRRRRR
ncbi:hypothetical protein, partial [Klebsiella aerogenes]|uniref:hypothetical protein n=1 Tax=Klebsiella aerogenes TaxID=548 RepID=UPI0019539986